MAYDLFPLQVLPGIATEGSPRELKNRWKSGNNVRFHNGVPEKIGGYVKAHDNQFTGKCRGLLEWRALDSSRYIAVGTHQRLNLFTGGQFYNITPILDSGTLTDPFSTTDGDTKVLVDDNSHGLSVGTFVMFSGASAVGGITIDGEYEVVEVPSANSFCIQHSSAATSTVSGGGGSVGYSYEIPAGAEDTAPGRGWGAGPYGRGTWGTARGTSGILLNALTWSLVDFGEDLIANPRGRAIYHWDKTNGATTRATEITQAPDNALRILLSQEDRHLIAYGAHDGSSDDLMNVRWCDQEDFTDWTPTDTNTAGDKRLDDGNEIVTAVSGRGEILILTDRAAYRQWHSGPPFTFSFSQVASGIEVAGPNAAVEFNGLIYWMGLNNFFMYDGRVRILPCEVHSAVFENLNRLQGFKVYAGRISRYSEVIWLYVPVGSTENAKFVLLNVMDGTWAMGEFERTAWMDAGINYDVPAAMGADGYLYGHETGTDADGDPLPYHLESWDIEISVGGAVMRVRGLMPDFKSITGTHSITLKSRLTPQGAQRTSGPKTITGDTEKLSIHSRGRQVAIRLESEELGAAFELGEPLVDGVAHGKK